MSEHMSEHERTHERTFMSVHTWSNFLLPEQAYLSDCGSPISQKWQIYRRHVLNAKLTKIYIIRPSIVQIESGHRKRSRMYFVCGVCYDIRHISTTTKVTG